MAKSYGIRFKEPLDIRRGAGRILNAILRCDDLTSQAGRYASVAHVWLKAYEIDKISDIEKRLEVLEEAQKDEGRS